MVGIQDDGWVAESLRRYLPAEAAGVAASLAAGLLFVGAGAAAAVAALAAAWAENTGYYAVIATRDFGGQDGGPIRRAGRTLVTMLVEFGPAELFDSLLVRPALLYAGLRLLPTPALGILAGKVAADLVFYLPTISSRRLLVRRITHNGREP
ncbi:MAG TPA: hypothetical protein VHJ78_10485 [Actinomycetota bacterium]|nr:hypothetical protein [Actinomycetota bacterium]